MAGQNENWMPLESNPEVINPYIEKMGLRLDQFAFTEMLSTEEWALEMIPKPAVGILFLYEETPVQQEFKQAQSASLKPEEVPANVFFMKQYARNACGTIALFHMILNAKDTFPEIIVPGSFLDNFLSNSSNVNPHERGELFKNNKDILNEHKQAVQEGQSGVQSECESHFIAFIPKNGRLYELDGFKACAVDHGECSQEEFLIKGSNVIREFMDRDPDNINFSMIVLASSQQQ